MAIRDYFRVDVLSYEYPEATEFYDQNWLNVQIRAQDQASRAGVKGAYLLTFELRDLADGARQLLAERTSEYTLTTVEPILNLSLQKCDELGHYRAEIRLQTEFDRHRSSQSIHEYRFVIDQTDLRIMEAQIQKLLQVYPVLGRP